jgi:hypothetical protein
LLLPPHLRNRAESRAADSIGDFRHQLRVLDRIGPTAVNPANSLRGIRNSVPAFGPGRPAAPRLASEVVAARRTAAARAATPEVMRRRASQRRRRDILFSLIGLTGLSGIVGFVPGLSAVWLVTAVVGLALALYVVLLVNMRNRAAEREMKLRFLPGGAGRDGRHGEPQPALLLRRSAN